MTLCMGKALSSRPNRPAVPKADLLKRIKNKLLGFRGDHGAIINEKKKHDSKRQSRRSIFTRRQQPVERRVPTQVSPSEHIRNSTSRQKHSSGSLQHVSSRPETSADGNPFREGVNDGHRTASSSSDIYRGVEEEEDGPTIRALAPVANSPPPAPASHGGLLTGAGDGEPPHDGEISSELARREEINKEIDWRWILNLSMHFRDQSGREKFFVTYAETPNLRRRLTVSCDYRDAAEGTLERELADMRYQRDKSAKIYEAIKESLPSIQFYETTTNLKLQTSEGRLHVHVTEDVQEIIPYPPVVAIAHLQCPKYKESELEFESHLSGFVYKVKIKDKVYIKKEIPGPDTVDEFLYEINALYALKGSQNVIRFGGCIVDERQQRVKGLLIAFAPKGALIDIIYNERGHLPWRLREKWAKQIVTGLSEVHEAGYVQGDFTLSNIVIDEKDDAKIIDINRRGCPVGWEPPEVTAMINGLQRIGMYIGVKSDIFQLGMVLWGIAHQIDEPEGVPRPLGMHEAPPEVPEYFKKIVDACLCERPQGRMSAKDIIGLFPDYDDGYIPRLGDGYHDDSAGIEGAGTGPGRGGYIIGEPDADGVVEVSLSGNGGRSGESGYNSGVTGLLLNGRASTEPDNHSSDTFTHPYRPSESGQEGSRSESSIGDRPHYEPHRINTHFDQPYEDLQVITASPGPSESGVSGDEPFAWSSIHEAAFGAGTGPGATTDIALDSPVSPTTMPPSRYSTTGTEDSIDKDRGEEWVVPPEPVRAEYNGPVDPIPRPTMNGRMGTKDSEFGERFTTARSSIDTRKSVAV